MAEQKQKELSADELFKKANSSFLLLKNLTVDQLKKMVINRQVDYTVRDGVAIIDANTEIRSLKKRGRKKHPVCEKCGNRLKIKTEEA